MKRGLFENLSPHQVVACDANFIAEEPCLSRLTQSWQPAADVLSTQDEGKSAWVDWARAETLSS